MPGPVIPMRHLWQERERTQNILVSTLPSTSTNPSSIRVPRWPFLQGHALFPHTSGPSLAHPAYIQPPNVLSLFSEPLRPSQHHFNLCYTSPTAVTAPLGPREGTSAPGSKP